MNKFLSRIPFKILIFYQQITEQSRNSLTLLGLPQFTLIFQKIWCWKILFICVTTSFLDMLRLEKTVCFESTDWNSNIQVHRPFFCQSKVFPVIDYVRTVKNPARCFSKRSKSIPSKQINRQGVEIQFSSRKQDDQTKKFSTQRTSGNVLTVMFFNRKLYVIERSKFSV